MTDITRAEAVELAAGVLAMTASLSMEDARQKVAEALGVFDLEEPMTDATDPELTGNPDGIVVDGQPSYMVPLYCSMCAFWLLVPEEFSAQVEIDEGWDESTGESIHNLRFVHGPMPAPLPDSLDPARYAGEVHTIPNGRRSVYYSDSMGWFTSDRQSDDVIRGVIDHAKRMATAAVIAKAQAEYDALPHNPDGTINYGAMSDQGDDD